MFTGIVEEMGTIERMSIQGSSGSIAIRAKKVLEDAHIGDSIAVNGICLTVTSFGSDKFTADVMAETVRRSSLKSLGSGSQVNLERAMGANSRFHSLFLPKYSIANSVILIYDIKNKESFEQCCYYKENIKKLCNEDIEVILLGNEQNEQIYDIHEKEREVSFEEGNKFAQLNNYFFMEISTKKNEGIDEAAKMAIKMALKNKRKRNFIDKEKNKENEKIMKYKKFKKNDCIII
jgi:hypothetical protein